MTEILGGKTATASVSARSIEALAEAHYPWVQRMCASLTGDVEEGQELAQEVMTVACRYFSTLHDPQAFRPWLKEVARNRFRDWLRKKYREEAALAHAVVAKGGSSMVETDDDHLDLRLAIGALPIAQRVPLVLHYFLEFAAIDRSLRAWCEGQPVEVRPARGPDRSAYAARAEVLPVNGAAEPSGVVGK